MSSDDSRSIAGRFPLARRAGVPASRSASCRLRPGRRPSSTSPATTVGRLRVLHPVQDVVGGLLQLGSSELGSDALEQRQDLAAMEPPGQARATCSRPSRAGRSHRRGMKASLRSTGKYGGSATLPSLPDLLQVEIAVERAVEEAGEEARSRVFERQAEGLEIPAVLAVPRRGQLLQGVADLCRSAGCGSARISSRRTPASGSSAMGADSSRWARARRAAAWRRVVVDSTLAVLAAVAAEDADGLLADRVGRRSCSAADRRHGSPAMPCRTQQGPGARSTGSAAAIERLARALSTSSRSALARSIKPRRAASWVAMFGDFNAAISPRTDREVGLDVFGFRSPWGRPGRSGPVVWSLKAWPPTPASYQSATKTEPSGAARHVDGPEPRVVAAPGRPCSRSGTRPLASDREEVDLPGAGVGFEDARRDTRRAADRPRRP